ncbi:DUF397 domain-containing protein [Streptantibioticus ferralitis]|uniref:DUF397 domain-containing protein n=1 Tax=Streptantibioticus ferralitis TaxID=236510 RepID=A0ABT5Z272_9ACTN|nr:DUF397 domain-containing protein [Streptantibioticus ferralitis]MDF2257933.1 DUF397 domain-containing protein [Streptantibioticus ferralitis]
MSTELAWFKSSYSDDQGANCVEVAISWHKSSYSDSEGGNCVEVAACLQDTVHVRDSKDKTGPQLSFTAAAWAEFISFAAAQPT